MDPARSDGSQEIFWRHVDLGVSSSLKDLQGSKVSEDLVRCTVGPDAVLVANHVLVMQSDVLLFWLIFLSLSLSLSFFALIFTSNALRIRESNTLLSNATCTLHVHSRSYPKHSMVIIVYSNASKLFSYISVYFQYAHNYIYRGTFSIFTTRTLYTLYNTGACTYTCMQCNPLFQTAYNVLIKGSVLISRGNSLYTSLCNWGHAWCPD